MNTEERKYCITAFDDHKEEYLLNAFHDIIVKLATHEINYKETEQKMLLYIMNKNGGSFSPEKVQEEIKKFLQKINKCPNINITKGE